MDVTRKAALAVLVVVGVEVRVEVRVSEGGAVAVRVDVFEGVIVVVGVSVGVESDARIAEPVALTEKTTCVTSNRKAIRAATVPRDARD